MSYPLHRSYLQRLLQQEHERIVYVRSQELACQCADLAVLKARAGHRSMSWSVSPDKLMALSRDGLTVLHVTHDLLLQSLKEKMPDVDIGCHQAQSYVYYLLDWS